ncbi:amyloid fiber anchoring/assembly protein TapA [Virgibacillus kekensis]|uniref:Amyloid fiber anchoring/assembly protein TapA n=1 Tax=Virgibacillus kekensis TaxID=202261 RepID=A0ABV9DE58_9BACI
MRSTRLKKYKKRRGFVIITQLAAIWYIGIIGAITLTSGTGAYFNDVEQIPNTIRAGYPPDNGVWEKSSLKEVSMGGSCETEFYARFTNTGESVDQELTKYEVYWLAPGANGSAKNGVVVETGTFPIPNKGEYYDIYYQPEKDGIYKIKAYHETGHAKSDNNTGSGPWSEDISCGPEPDSETEIDREQEETETQPDIQKSTEETMPNGDSDSKENSNPERKQTKEDKAEVDSADIKEKDNNEAEDETESDTSESTSDQNIDSPEEDVTTEENSTTETNNGTEKEESDSSQNNSESESSESKKSTESTMK